MTAGESARSVPVSDSDRTSSASAAAAAAAGALERNNGSMPRTASSSTATNSSAGIREASVSGGENHDIGNNKDATGSPLSPATVGVTEKTDADAAAAAMPPPPKREQREELGLVEQLTNMVEVFDICDLLRRVSTSNRSLDKSGSGGMGGLSKPGSSQHLRQMSIDTDNGVPTSPQTGDRSSLPSLASMELMRDSSRDWDTLMAGSADVSDLGNTMVQSVAEFFSF